MYNNKKTIDFQLEICYHKTYISDKGTLLCNILNIIGKSIAHNLRFVSSNHWHFFQVPCFMGKSLLAWAFALHKHAAVWAPIIQAPHTGALITHAL